MGLLARLRGTDPDNPRINAHGFQAAMAEWADGAAGFSRASLIFEFKLTTNDESDLDAIKTIYDTANTNAKKARLLKAFDSVVMLASDRDNSFYKTNSAVIARLTEAAS